MIPNNQRLSRGDRNHKETPVLIRYALTAYVLCSIAQAQTIIIDNTDPEFSVLSQVWITTSIAGQYGSNYAYRATSLATGDVEWRPSIPTSGTYQVDVWYRAGNDRPNNAPYEINYDGGSIVIPVDQRINGSQWVPLGAFPFAAGSSASVNLSSNAQTGKTLIADAVRFTLVSGGDEVPELRACWLTHYAYLGRTESSLRQMAANMKAGNINTVYIAVYAGQQVYWPSKAYRDAGGNWGSSAVDYAAYLSRIFREEGLSVGAWFEYGLALGFSGHPIATANPDWLARDNSGDAITGENGGFVFISPGSQPGTQMVVEMARELAENYWFDDIQIDRFRWGRKSSGREYGYEDATSDLYFATYGSNPPNNVNNNRWVRFREGLVNDVVERCYDAIKSANPQIVVSSAPTGFYGIVQHMQRWSDWIAGGYLDLVMPQMYQVSYSGFVSEFNNHANEMPAGHFDKLAVGYRASDTTDWQTVADQMVYARNQGVMHGTLWVYHFYTSQVAIQDEIDNLPQFGQPWQQKAYNPFVSNRNVVLVIDNDDVPPAYVESTPWTNSSQSDFFRFDSRIADGAGVRTAQFATHIPKAGRYDVYVWYTASANRNPAADYSVFHHNGSDIVTLDQRTNGGQWVNLGRYMFDESNLGPRVLLTSTATPGVFTSADAVKLMLSGYAFGDSNGDGMVGSSDYQDLDGCDLSGPELLFAPTHCEAFDLNDDGDTDVTDFAAMQSLAG